MLPICPKCGSVRMERDPETRKLVCQEPDCADVAQRRGLGMTTPRRYTNQHWRDPVAMSMDGYEGE